MKSIIITDPISEFKRDQIPFVLRIQRTVSSTTELGEIVTVQTDGVIDLVNRVTRGDFARTQRLKLVKDTVVYLLLGYREGLSLKYSETATMEALRYCLNYFDSLGYGIRIVLPIVKSRRVNKKQKNFFRGIHKEIKTLTDELDDMKILSCPLVAKDPTSPNGESIVAMAQLIGHEIIVRKIKDVVATDVKRPKRRVKRTAQNLKKQTDDRIIIREEIPSKFKRGKKTQGV